MSPTAKHPEPALTPVDADPPQVLAEGTGATDEANPLSTGVSIIAEAQRLMPERPGVYRMLDRRGEALYVGKAKQLKKRVIAYTHPDRLPIRLQRMIAATRKVEIVTTQTEAEALLLESNLIKTLKPRFNILLRDDKSFPYVLITGDHAWPRIMKYRGTQSKIGDYYGPFASAGAVNQSLSALQKAFLLRSCSDSVFANRTRPCLLYQIKRCCAPCVDRVSPEAYRALVGEARAFLTGKSHRIQTELAEQMEAASARLAFEEAAGFRDRLRALAKLQAHQDVNLPHIGEADIVAGHGVGGQVCIQVFFFRNGQNFGNRAFFPVQTADAELKDVLSSFLGQFYASRQPPKEILVSEDLDQTDLIAEALSLKAGRRIALAVPKRGPRRKLIEHARRNAREALDRRIAESSSQRKLLEALAETFDLPAMPERIEVYDNSHIQGHLPVGAMIVAGPEGFERNQYRKFNIKSREIAPGDDFAMMREVLTRRFARAVREDPGRESGHWPDLVLIDGGKGQLGVALSVFADLGVDDIAIAAIAKGPDRDAGHETIFLPETAPIKLRPNDPVLYFLQRLRDEAHRFAVGSHRARRKKTIAGSPLDTIPGIGAKRKKALLHRFGSARGVAEAGVEDLMDVDGISRDLAETVLRHFQGGGS